MLNQPFLFRDFKYKFVFSEQITPLGAISIKIEHKFCHTIFGTLAAYFLTVKWLFKK